jgi:hypothetical protein
MELNAEIYTYEQFCVAQLLWGKKGENDVRVPNELEGFAFPPDLYAPNGILALGLEGKTVIEVKKLLSYATVKEMNALYETHGTNYNVLVVYFSKSISRVPEEMKEQGKTIKYISLLDLKRIYKKKSEINKEDYYAKKAKKNDWITDRKETINRAQEAISQGNCVMFLGAGVSMSAKLPSWNDLLKGLMGEVKQLRVSTLEAFKELNTHVLDECGDSYLIMARYLQTAIKLYNDKTVFSELIQKYLYNDNNTSELLTQLALIVQQKKVNEVITYNFDDLLEQNLEKLQLKDSIDYTSISKDAEIKGHNTLPIYHVHGIIPKAGPVDTVVFSEEEYHSRYSNAFHWSNIEQLHALSRMHCFFIGLSMTDPNLRRLLDIAKKMNENNGDSHFAFLRRKKLEKYCISDIERSCKYVHVSESLINKKKQKEIYDLNYTVIERIFMELGVRVIWYEEFDDLPELVAEVFGLSRYKGQSDDSLIKLCEVKIKEIQDIEDNQPKLNVATMTIMDVSAFKQYNSTHGEAYRKDVDDVKDILNELSSRITMKKMLEKNMDLRDIQNRVPKFNENLSGFGQFFSAWFEAVKAFFE